MKISINYINDTKGILRAVQLPIAEWKRMLATIRKYEQALKVQSDLISAYAEVDQLRFGKLPKKELSAFLNEL